jgi:hypothetical protein
MKREKTEDRPGASILAYAVEAYLRQQAGALHERSAQALARASASLDHAANLWMMIDHKDLEKALSFLRRDPTLRDAVRGAGLRMVMGGGE